MTASPSRARPLLLEIGVEELPSSFVDAALAALPRLVEEKLDQLRLAHGAVRAFGTPRRLAVLVDDLAPAQGDLDEEVVGPPEAVAFKDGKPTKAAEAFAAKIGVAVESLGVADKAAGPKQKAGRFLVGRRKEKGQEASALLGGSEGALAQVCGRIPFRKSMRWGSGDTAFGRPIQWLVALLGENVVDATFAGVKSGRTTRGHRFLAPEPFAIDGADRYVAQLREAHVLVDREERARTMMEGVAEAATKLGGAHDPDPALIDENASLVEEPHVVVGSFSPEYLSLPASVIRAVARGHQKYFCVAKGGDADALLPHYLTVANTANVPEKVAKGNDRVMRSRLADAAFFFEEDKRIGEGARAGKLGGIVFHARLGTVHDKVKRLERLTTTIADRLGASAETKARIGRAVLLCKTDLVSLMVGEFPELQGHMGRAYALAAGEDPAIADAIRDHYKPVGADDSVAPGDVSAVIALADRLDSLVGCFAIGLAPTGTADPYALRRACIAILRTLVESAAREPAYARLDLGALLGDAYDGFTGVKLDLSRGDAQAKVLEFARDRLRGILAAASSAPVADAVLGGHAWVSGEEAAVERFPAYAAAKARALQAVVDAKADWLAKARTVAKRLDGISKDAQPVLHAKEAFGASDKDGTIHGVVTAIDAVTAALDAEATVSAALNQAAELARRIDDIFVQTLVNDPNDERTPRRLELLSYGAKCMLRIGDFSKLAGT